MPSTDPFERTVRIHVEWRNGAICQLGGDALPKLLEGSVGELIMPAYAIQNLRDRDMLLAERTVELLPADSQVLVGVSANMIGEDVADLRKKIPKRPEGLIDQSGWLFVEVTLSTPLRLRLRGSKTPQLLDCTCHIALLEKDAVSVNHAFTLISTALETRRRSHSGNVFSRVYAKRDRWWVTLDALREKAIIQLSTSPERGSQPMLGE